ncbi:MAG: hypothetical protein WC494_00935 [Candidatus Pacearchaeota archaeon]
MKKKVFIGLLFFIIILSFSLLAFFNEFLKENEEVIFANQSSEKEENNPSNKEVMIPEPNIISIDSKLNNRDDSSEGSNDEVFGEEDKESPSCILIRPGNLPDITCGVNYINRDEISIKLKNEIGENLGIIINIENCQPEIKEELKNEEEKSFIFFCESPEEFFKKQISISYIINQTERIDINGFIMGGS